MISHEPCFFPFLLFPPYCPFRVFRVSGKWQQQTHPSSPPLSVCRYRKKDGGPKDCKQWLSSRPDMISLFLFSKIVGSSLGLAAREANLLRRQPPSFFSFPLPTVYSRTVLDSSHFLGAKSFLFPSIDNFLPSFPLCSPRTIRKFPTDVTSA